MMKKMFLYLWLATLIATDLQNLCQNEMAQNDFPINCFRWFNSQNAGPTSATLRRCKDWSERQKEELLLMKVRQSEVVPEDCKASAKKQIELLHYQQGLTD